VISGAEAAFRALAYAPGHGWMLWIYRSIPGAGLIAEQIYRFIARHRSAFSFGTRCLIGTQRELPSYALTRNLFLKGLALVYLAAFASLSGPR